METIEIAPLKIRASRICLGTWAIGGWMWGGKTDEPEAIKTIHFALDRGINMIDTAPVYGFGIAETLVGKALQQYGHRDRIILATKVGLEWQENKIFRNSTPQRIQTEIEDSLKRLKTDYIDLYQVHWPDDKVAFEETAETLLSLLNQGKIRSIGVSNYSSAQMAAFQKIAPVHASQVPYNLFNRSIEHDVFPYTEKQNIPTLAYGSIARGLLSGKMTIKSHFPEEDLRKDDPMFQPPRFEQYLSAVKALNEFAKQRYQKEVLALAIRWVLDRGHTIALWGARHPEQLASLEEAMGWSLDMDAMKEIDGILKNHIVDQ